MIVAAGSIQAEYVKKYGLGVVVDDCSNLDVNIKSFLSTFDYSLFCENCNKLLRGFVEDHEVLKSSIAAFVRI